MFGFLGDNIDSVQQAAKANHIGQKDTSEAPGAAGLTAGLPGFGGLWGVAKAVQSAVQQTADEVVRSVQQTDWKSELAAFTQEVEAEAHKAVEVVQHLPAQLHTRTSESGGDGQPGSAGVSPTGSAGSGSAQQPFGAVGSSLANFGKQLISGTKEVFDTVTDLVEGEIATASREVPRFAAGSKGSGSGGRSEAAARLASRQRLATKYSRFEAEVASMQRDSATYVDEPEDAEDFAAWRGSSFSMSSVQPGVDKILSGNAFMSELQSRLVPLLVEKEDFWARYFYRLHKLQQKEEQRQQLAARAKQLDDAEELGGWDDDDSPHAATAAAATAATAGAAAAEPEGGQQQQLQQEAESGPQPEPEQEKQQEQQEQLAATAAADAPGRSSGGSGGDSSPTPDASSTPVTTSAAEAAAAAPQQPDAAAAGPAHSSSLPSKATDAGGSAAATAAAATVAAAVAAGPSGRVLPRKVSDDSSLPSTPVQVGSDASDALATDTVSEGSGATGAGGQGGASSAPWTLVTGSPSAPAAADAAASGKAAESAARQQQGQPAAAGSAGGSSPAAPADKPAAAGAVAKPAAAAAAAAAAVDDDEDDEDDDWGDDADDAVAAVSSKAGTAAAAAAAAAGDADDDWGNWE